MVSKRKTNAFGFPIKDFGNDKKGRSSPLNDPIDYEGRRPFIAPLKRQKPKEEEKTWIPDKKFRE